MSTQTLTRFYCSFCDAIKNFFKGFVTESRFDPGFDHKGYKQLSRLSDYELKDIGITRGDIDHICRGGKVYRGSF
jgi:hypothetical protein